MLSVVALSAVAFAPTMTPRRGGVIKMETAEDLKALAEKQNPVLGFWDPLNLVGYNQWDQGEAATIGFLRHAELKHGRVAMAAFVGYIVQSNGICFPWPLTGGGFGGETILFSDIAAAGSPPEQWDALPTAAKLQILGMVGLFEIFGENTYLLEKSGEKHYMRGGKPGFFPSIKADASIHPVPLDLWDPFGFTKKMSAERKETLLTVEVNNGRAAMFGIMGFLAAAKVPGSVPALTFIKPYAGEVMAPFSAGDVSLPYVADMLAQKIF